MKAAVTDKDTKRKIVPERYAVLGEVYNEFSNLSGRTPEMKLLPNFAMGGVSIEFPVLDFGPDGVSKFTETLNKCNTFEVYTLTNGNIRLSVTVSGVFESEE